MIGMIAAVSSNGVIGKDNTIPFRYSEDMKWFKKNTLDSVVIMGRKTFESMGKPLPKRENIVITSQKLDIPGIRCFSSIESFFNNEKLVLRDHIVDYWFIGGAQIYEEGMSYADKIYLTITPDVIEGDNLVKYPWINALRFEVHKIYDLENNSPLKIIEYARKNDI